MFTKLSLTIVSIIALVSLAGCGSKSPTLPASSATPGSPQSSTSITPTESDAADNYQMLPMISGKVANVSLDATADGSTQQLKIGEVLSVSLESNPSTGYSWFATISNPAVLVQMGEPQYQAPSSSTPIVGAAGTQIFFFQAAETGTATLTLDYLRSFESGVAPEKTVTITVEVK
jgi:inhibitor of cysteine peptidase